MTNIKSVNEYEFVCVIDDLLHKKVLSQIQNFLQTFLI